MQRFRPMGLGDIFDEAFDLYKRHFVTLLLITAAVVVPFSILIGYLQLHAPSAQGSPPDWWDLIAWLGWEWDSFLAFPAPSLLTGVAFALEYTALASAVWMFYLDQPASPGLVYRDILRRILPLLGTALLYAVCLGLGGLLCGVGLLWPLTSLLFLCPIFVAERTAGFAAVRRSGQLVKDYGGRVVGALLLLAFVTGFFALGLTLPINYILDLLFQIAPTLPGAPIGGVMTGLAARQQMIAQISEGLAGLLVTPFAVSVVTILYYDLRVRKEAFDLDLLARGLNYPPLAALSGYLPPALPILMPHPGVPPPPPAPQGGPR